MAAQKLKNVNKCIKLVNSFAYNKHMQNCSLSINTVGKY